MEKLLQMCLLVLSIQLIQFASKSDGCSCMVTHPQEIICRENSYVALVRVQSQNIVREKNGGRGKRSANPANLISITRTRLEENEISDKESNLMVPTPPTREVIIRDESKTGLEHRRYRIKIHKIFKGFKAGTDKEKLYLYSATDEALCGVKLANRKTYLIIGTVSYGRLTVSLCDRVIPWKTLPRNERRNIKKNMKLATSSCDLGCKVTSCPWEDCLPKSRKECTWTGEMERAYGARFYRENVMCVADRRGDCNWNVGAIKKQSKKHRRRRHNYQDGRNVHHSLP
ncbi:metalloproteinase inhibitor 3-like [Ciona intestinalis]